MKDKTNTTARRSWTSCEHKKQIRKLLIGELVISDSDAYDLNSVLLYAAAVYRLLRIEHLVLCSICNFIIVRGSMSMQRSGSVFIFWKTDGV